MNYVEAMHYMQSGGQCRLNGLLYTWYQDSLSWFDGLRWHPSTLHYAYRHHKTWEAI